MKKPKLAPLRREGNQKGDWDKVEARMQEIRDNPVFNREKYSKEKYEEIHELAAGHSATVHLVKVCVGPGQWVQRARKTIPLRPLCALGEDQGQRIVKEIGALRKASEVYVVKFFDAFTVGDNVLIFTEYMKYGSLFTLYATCGPIENKHLDYIAPRILRCLQSIHFHGLLHRDIKPANIVVGANGIVKLCDFGDVKELSPGSVGETYTGTANYLAPERLGGKDHSKPADIWSVGISLLEIRLAKHPDIIVMEDLFELIESRVSSAMVDFLKLCLENEAQKRWSADNLLEKNAYVKSCESSQSSVADIESWADGRSLINSLYLDKEKKGVVDMINDIRTFHVSSKKSDIKIGPYYVYRLPPNDGLEKIDFEAIPMGENDIPQVNRKTVELKDEYIVFTWNMHKNCLRWLKMSKEDFAKVKSTVTWEGLMMLDQRLCPSKEATLEKYPDLLILRSETDLRLNLEYNKCIWSFKKA